jgi:hypothetical protein
LDSDKDQAVWKWNASKKFSVKSVYDFLARNDVGLSYSRVWRAKLPEKIKKIMWLVEQKAILTKDNMMKEMDGRPWLLFFVDILKLVTTCCLNVLWQR